MAWSCTGKTNEQLINNLYREQLITTPLIKKAMLKVDRIHFCRLDYTKEEAYDDCPLPLNHSVTISAPHMHAMALEYLKDAITKPGSKSLDVGSGSGYLVSCILNTIIENEGGLDDKIRVVGIEYLDEIAHFSKDALQVDLKQHGDEINKMYTIITGDGWKGNADEAPFDAIHVGAAAEKIPQSLVDQLAVGGRMVIPVGPKHGMQYLCLVDKQQNGTVVVKEVTGVRYVPLVNPDNEKAFQPTKISRSSLF